MRHAKSSWGDSSLRDFERPLNKRGRRDAPAMGTFLSDRGLVPDHIVCSPAERARETISLLIEAMKADRDIVHYDEALYHEGAEAYLDAIRHAPVKAGTVLVAGHNPTIEQVVSRLSGGTAGHTITTANVACFTTSATDWSDVSELSTTFKWITGPGDLKD